ncbi:Single myb histone 6 [Glycine max]|nr:Single myb histone 6 [Glycine max]
MGLVDNHILEAIVYMKEQKGSDKAAIASFIEEKYRFPPNLSKLLPAKLKHMVASGKIIKEKHKYRIAPSSTVSEKRRCSSLVLLEDRPKDPSEAHKNDDVNILLKSQIDAEISKVKGLTAQEAAAAAAKAVAEAETAIAQAEAAAREAEAAEAEAEAAQALIHIKGKMETMNRLNLLNSVDLLMFIISRLSFEMIVLLLAMLPASFFVTVHNFRLTMRGKLQSSNGRVEIAMFCCNGMIDIRVE